MSTSTPKPPVGKRFRLIAIAAVVAAAGYVGLPAPTYAAVPNQTGCPADGGTDNGWQLMSVDQLTAQGYRVPQSIDKSGNNDGWVCGRTINDTQAAKICSGPCPVPLYLFRDNTVTMNKS